MKSFSTLVLLAACTVEPPPSTTPTWTTTWSPQCGDGCPAMLRTEYVSVLPGPRPQQLDLHWWDSVGDEDVFEAAAIDGVGAVILFDRTDDDGTRYRTTLAVDGDGFVGDVTWFLDTVADERTWHLGLRKTLPTK